MGSGPAIYQYIIQNFVRSLRSYLFSRSYILIYQSDHLLGSMLLTARGRITAKFVLITLQKKVGTSMYCPVMKEPWIIFCIPPRHRPTSRFYSAIQYLCQDIAVDRLLSGAHLSVVLHFQCYAIIISLQKNPTQIKQKLTSIVRKIIQYFYICFAMRIDMSVYTSKYEFCFAHADDNNFNKI